MPPAGFAGELRDYQREGLGWLHFLRRFGFGGCLADDMGLGKTVQVLALLAARATAPTGGEPRARRSSSCPRSLVFNWMRGGRAVHARSSRVLDYTGADRARAGEQFDGLRPRAHDLRHAAARRRRRSTDVEFDYVILDEAQAIKNADTAVGQGRAPAARASTAWR